MLEVVVVCALCGRKEWLTLKQRKCQELALADVCGRCDLEGLKAATCNIHSLRTALTTALSSHTTRNEFKKVCVLKGL